LFSYCHYPLEKLLLVVRDDDLRDFLVETVETVIAIEAEIKATEETPDVVFTDDVAVAFFLLHPETLEPAEDLAVADLPPLEDGDRDPGHPVILVVNVTIVGNGGLLLKRE
jgi:hypothetical protein